MRVIAGLHKGRRLNSIKGNKIRPTTDRVKEAIFSVLAGNFPTGAVLDLFAGSGALGIEALSRGASHVTFVDKELDSIDLIRSNLELIKEQSRASVLKGDAFRICQRLGRHSAAYDIIFADPPYRTKYHEELIKVICQNSLLSEKGVIVYETNPDFEFAASLEYFSKTKIKDYGDTKVWFMYQ